jgi:TolB-like protein/Tfp pilus assembly protein PilF
MSFYEELKRRNVARVAVLYVIASWLLLQVTDVLSSLLPVPEWAGSFVVMLLLLGFLPVMIFSWVYEMTPEGLKREKDIDRSQSITPDTGRKINVLIIVMLALAIVTVVADRLIPETTTVTATSAIEELVETEAIDVSQPASGRLVPTPGHSIAVLPFVNMSNDPEQEYFSDGISEELLNVLAQYPDLRVAARTSSFQFKGKNPDIADIAEKLHVNHVLEGSVRKSGNTLRITAQLIEADTGFHLWSETYDRELIDVFAIQDEISAAIGDALKIQLALDGGTGKTSPTVLVAASTAAFDAYMQGRQLINLRGKRNLEEAVTHLERALALDETYAPAHAQLAIAISLLSNSPGSYGDLTLEEVRRRAMPHIDRALELDERLPEAFAAGTILSLVTAKFDVVVLNAKRSLELNPSNADVLNWLYIGQIANGRYVEAYEALEQLLSVDPLSVVGRYNRANKLALLDRTMGAARAMADSMFGQNPTFMYATHAAISYYAGNSDEAVKWALKSLSLDPQGSFVNTTMSRALGQLNLLPEALRLPNDAHYWAYLNMRMWPELVVVARQRLDKDPSDPNGQLYLANALHLSGAIEQAQVLYEQRLALHPDLPIIDTSSETNAATARAALGRLRAGDEAGARKLIELTTDDLRQRNRAGFVHGEYYRSAALIAALEGDNDAAMENIEKAIEKGPRDPTLFSEPGFDALRDSQEFQALESRLDSILAAQRVKALQMMCFNNPVRETWQPLPETCVGVDPPVVGETT